MRILHVNKFLYRRGGAEAYALDLGGFQRDAGHRVEFFAMQHADNFDSRYAAQFPSQLDFDPAPDRAVDKARLGARMIWSTSAARGITAVLDDFKPDIVHAHNIYHQLSPSIFRPMSRRGIPIVLTLHDYKLACPTYNFLSHGEICEACLGGRFTQVVRRRCQGGLASSALVATEMTLHSRLGAYRPVTLFHCPSNFMADKMAASGIDQDRLRQLNLFVDLDQPAKSAPGTGAVYVGRLSVEKGVDVLVRAIGELPDAQLDIVEAGAPRAGTPGR